MTKLKCFKCGELNMSRAKLLTIIVLLGMLGSLQIVASPINMAMNDSHPSIVADYEVHVPIVITSNEDFSSQGWPGNGTSEDPYVIEGLSIYGGAGEFDMSIDISFVTAYFVIKDCLITSSQYGISTVYTSNGLIIDNVINDIDTGSIYLREQSNNMEVINNTIDNAHIGIYFWGWYDNSTDVTVIGNTISNTHIGIYLDRAVSVVVADNNCDSGGIELSGAISIIVENNTSNGGQYGIRVTDSNNVSVRWNIMRNNYHPGYSSNSESFFDYNYYHDYNGLDENDDRIGDTPYNKDGVLDAHPMMYPPGYGPPVVDHPEDMEFESGIMEHSIVWISSPLYPYLGLFPYIYKLYMNGTLIDTNSDTTAEVCLDDLDAGLYNYTIVIIDDDGNSVNDTVLVTVIDTISPLLDSPEDIEYVVGETENRIRWIVFDFNPDIYELYINGSLDESISWDALLIVIDVDGLEVGQYNYTLLVKDTSGNIDTDTVIVSVTEIVTTTDVNESDTIPLDLVILLFASIGGICGIIALVIVIKRR